MTEKKVPLCNEKPKKTNKMNRGPISQFITHHYRHFNAATLVDAAVAYDKHLAEGGKMMITMGGRSEEHTSELQSL